MEFNGAGLFLEITCAVVFSAEVINLNNLKVFDVTSVDSELDKSTHMLPSLLSGCTRIDMKSAGQPVGHNLENM